MREKVTPYRTIRQQAFDLSKKELQEMSKKDKNGAWVYRDSPLHLRFRAVPVEIRAKKGISSMNQEYNLIHHCFNSLE